jgi:hypothetical protein
MRHSAHAIAAIAAIAASASAAPVITIHSDSTGHAISPGIYGINALANGGGPYLAADSAMLGSDRMGGNRMTGYNWENNYSNAGSDWQFNSDNWMTQNPLPTPNGRRRFRGVLRGPQPGPGTQAHRAAPDGGLRGGGRKRTRDRRPGGSLEPVGQGGLRQGKPLLPRAVYDGFRRVHGRGGELPGAEVRPRRPGRRTLLFAGQRTRALGRNPCAHPSAAPDVQGTAGQERGPGQGHQGRGSVRQGAGVGELRGDGDVAMHFGDSDLRARLLRLEHLRRQVRLGRRGLPGRDEGPLGRRRHAPDRRAGHPLVSRGHGRRAHRRFQRDQRRFRQRHRGSLAGAAIAVGHHLPGEGLDSIRDDRQQAGVHPGPHPEVHRHGLARNAPGPDRVQLRRREPLVRRVGGGRRPGGLREARPGTRQPAHHLHGTVGGGLPPLPQLRRQGQRIRRHVRAGRQPRQYELLRLR